MDETKTDIITVPRVVIDTNVCLDLFVFNDPRWIPLLAEIEAGAIEAVTRADCRAEYLYVLNYPHLPLDDTTRAQAAERFDRTLRMVAPPHRPVLLPACTDRDDQKFLELARDAEVDALITKDKALLKLAKRTAKAGLFRILLPEAWLKTRPATEGEIQVG